MYKSIGIVHNFGKEYFWEKFSQKYSLNKVNLETFYEISNFFKSILISSKKKKINKYKIIFFFYISTYFFYFSVYIDNSRYLVSDISTIRKNRLNNHVSYRGIVSEWTLRIVSGYRIEIDTISIFFSNFVHH